MDIELRGISIENFRAFGTRVEMEDLGAFNLITGPNNVGKSSLLMPLRRLTRMDPRYVPIRGTLDGAAFFGSDHHARLRPNDIRPDTQPKIKIQIHLDTPLLSALLKRFFSSSFADFVMITEPCPTRLDLEIENKHKFFVTFAISEQSRNSLGVFLASLPGYVPSQIENSLKQLAIELANALASKVLYIPSFRVVGRSLTQPDRTEHEERMYDGSSLLADLLSWCLPDPASGAPPRVHRLQQLCEETSRLLDVTVRIWPTADQQIKVAIGRDEPRRLEDLGQGIAQLINIVAGVLSMDEPPILLLEEPEVCLHAGLQRRLVEYLAGRSGQTFVTTHSNHLIDAAGDRARLFLLRHDVETDSRAVIQLSGDLLRALQELGVTASSIAAAGAVIWVEGPSDAIYLRHWLSRDPRGRHYREGRDFTFAFHGGALLAHVGIDDEIVNLLGVHPGFFLIADSDRRAPDHKPAHPYLERLLQNDALRGRLWITEPKEIEGYVPDRGFSDEILAGNTTDVYSKLSARLIMLGMSENASNQKVKLAREVVARLARLPDEEVLGPYDLRVRVGDVVSFIEACRLRLPAIVPGHSEPVIEGT